MFEEGLVERKVDGLGDQVPCVVELASRGSMMILAPKNEAEYEKVISGN